MTLNEKEKALLYELRIQEDVCAQTYERHATLAKDPQLKGLFQKQADTERFHAQLLDQIGAGQVPFVDMGKLEEPTQFTPCYGACSVPDKENDQYLCRDLLGAEKQASALYNAGIFHFVSQGVRDVLNYIQRAEQFHGKQISDYMTVNAMTGA